MNGLFDDLGFICAYIYGIQVLTKRAWRDNVQKLELTINTLKKIGLKYNI